MFWQVWTLKFAFDPTRKFRVGMFRKWSGAHIRVSHRKHNRAPPTHMGKSSHLNSSKPRNLPTAPLSSEENASSSVFSDQAIGSTLAAIGEWPRRSCTTLDTLHVLRRVCETAGARSMSQYSVPMQKQVFDKFPIMYVWCHVIFNNGRIHNYLYRGGSGCRRYTNMLEGNRQAGNTWKHWPLLLWEADWESSPSSRVPAAWSPPDA